MKIKLIRLLEKLKLKGETRNFAKWSGYDNTFLSHILSERRKCPIGYGPTICEDIEEYLKKIKSEKK